MLHHDTACLKDSPSTAETTRHASTKAATNQRTAHGSAWNSVPRTNEKSQQRCRTRQDQWPEQQKKRDGRHQECLEPGKPDGQTVRIVAHHKQHDKWCDDDSAQQSGQSSRNKARNDAEHLPSLPPIPVSWVCRSSHLATRSRVRVMVVRKRSCPAVPLFRSIHAASTCFSAASARTSARRRSLVCWSRATRRVALFT